MAKVNISLEQSRGCSILVEVPIELIKDASILVYQGEYYTFGGTGGRFFTDIKFVKVNPPVVLPEPEDDSD